MTGEPTTGGVIRLTAHGEIDLAAGHVLDVLLWNAQEEEAAVVLDLADVSFMDSTGLHLALDAQARARRAGTCFTVARSPPNVHRLFALAGLEHRLE